MTFIADTQCDRIAPSNMLDAPITNQTFTGSNAICEVYGLRDRLALLSRIRVFQLRQPQLQAVLSALNLDDPLSNRDWLLAQRVCRSAR